MSWLALHFPIFVGEDCVQQCTFYHGEASVTCKKDLQQDIIFPHLSLSASRLGIHPVTSETKLQHGSPQKNASSPSHGAEWSYEKTFLRMATKWGIPSRQTYVWQRWQRWPVNRHQMAADPNAVLSKWQAKLLQLPAVSRDIWWNSVKTLEILVAIFFWEFTFLEDGDGVGLPISCE